MIGLIIAELLWNISTIIYLLLGWPYKQSDKLNFCNLLLFAEFGSRKKKYNYVTERFGTLINYGLPFP